jgi:O-antigen ligase
VITSRCADRSTARTGLAGRFVGDLVGPALLVALGIWTILTTAGSQPAVRSAVSLFAGTAAVLVVAQLLGRLTAAPTVPWGVLLLVLPVAWMSSTDFLADGRMDEPLGYPNAQAAFFVLGAIAAMMAVVASRRLVSKVGGVLATAILSTIVIASGSLAAAILLLVALLAVLAHRLISDRIIVWALGSLLLLALATAVVLGASYQAGAQPGASVLSQRRLALWGDALHIIREHPLTGVGTGRFRISSPTARSDQDAAWTHNDFLQQGAESGLIGAGLLLGLFLWGFWRLAARAGSDVVVVLAASSLAVMGVHASIDYVLRFPAVTLVGAALVGWAMGATANANRPTRETV